MSTNKHIDIFCFIGVLLSLLLTLIFVNAQALGVQTTDTVMGYESRLFDNSRVHTIEIVVDDWEDFLETCENKEYVNCSVIIDNQAYKNVAIRAKGNNSLSTVSSYGNDRYSFKIEFDHYDSTKSYYGLDKLNLNNLIHDNTMMKDHLTYQMMCGMGVAAPLSSYAYITVNGEDWGLYLAVEGIEESFLLRNYGSNYGELYKPDSLSNNGGEPGGFNGSDVKLQYINDDPGSYSNIFNNAKTEITEADQERLITALKQLNDGINLTDVLDIDAVIRYFVVHNFVCNFDSYTGSMVHNYYLYEENGVLSMIPWDYNLGYGSFQSDETATGIVNFPIDTPVSGSDLTSLPMLAWIFNNKTYTEQYHQVFAQFVSEYFDQRNFEQLVNETATLISPYVEKDPTKFCTYEEFEMGVTVLKDFCLLRAKSVSGQLNGSIPSTNDGQNADNSSLIDASRLNLSDMGSMNGGAPVGNGQMSGKNRQQLPENIGQPRTEQQESRTQRQYDWAQSDESYQSGRRQIAPAVNSDHTQQMVPNENNGPDTQGSPSDFGNREDKARPGDMQNSDNTNGNESNYSAVLSLIISIIVLLCGLALTLFFKRR